MAEPKAKAKHPKLPVVMTANDLLDGQVVFLGADGWSFDPHVATVAADEGTVARLEEEAAIETRANRIVEPYLVAVEIGPDGGWNATHFREAIRQRGPTTHPEMGKQAEF